MIPTLLVIFGPLQGSSFPLTENEAYIGREPSNWLAVSDPLLSRRHCVIRNEGVRFTICDLESRNGISVNGIPVREKTLHHGDQIQMGDSLFLFLLQDETIPSSEKTPEEPLARSTTQLRLEDALYLKPEKILAVLPPTARVAQDLNSLLKISKAVNSISDLETLLPTVLELTFEVTPAKRGMVLLTDDRSCALNRESGSIQPFTINGALRNQVLEDRVGVVSNDIQKSKSICSILCVPLVVFDNVLGLLYLDTNDSESVFDQIHLELVTAIAGIASIAIKNAQQVQWLLEENRQLQIDINIDYGMIGESPSMEKVYQFIKKVAATDSTVLICGESGTGKELAARGIHLNSPRSTRPFIALNCAAIVETLLESELFGHEKGAFTGAGALKKGKLEIADGGTVFLDEVSEMSAQVQAKLLRVLQEREFERVGGTHRIKVDIRLIAATNKNLQELVQTGRFRADLYYRLNVVNLTIPPLRDRRQDIPLLASYFAAKYGGKFQRRVKGISPEARHTLLNYQWPGNVRELENAMEHAVVLGTTDLIHQEDLPETLLEIEYPVDVSLNKYHEGVKHAKKRLILDALDQSNGDINLAAKRLGVNVTYLYRLIRNLNLKEPSRVNET